MQKIILLGYMGSGKSLIGKLLSIKLRIDVVDLDNYIEKRQNLSIKTIFKNDGEDYFRQIERRFFQELLKSYQKMIISLGGGTPCYLKNFKLYKNEQYISIYLKASVETLQSRIMQEKSNRPIIINVPEFGIKDFIAKQLIQREFYYNKSKFIVTVDNKSPEEIVAEICMLKIITDIFLIQSAL